VVEALSERSRDPAAPVMRSSIGAVLRERAAAAPDRKALLWFEGEVLHGCTYAELLARARACGAWIARHARPGDVVAVWGRNSIDWLVAEYGCALSGTVLCGFNTAWTDPEVLHAIGLTEPRMVLAELDGRGNDLLPRARALAPEAIVEPLLGLWSRCADEAVDLPDAGPEAPFLIQFTSGTTGRAKGAMLSHSAALNGGLLRVTSGGATAEDVFLNASPLHHIAGSVSLVIGTLVAGAAYVIVERVDPRRMLAMIRATGATRIGGVPTILKDILELPEFPEEGIRLTSVGIGGSSVPEALVHRLAKAFHAAISVGYGQSESPLIANSDVGDPAAIVATTVGRASPQNDIKLVDLISGATVPIGEVGEICVRSPANMAGYYRMPAASLEVIDGEGWLRTGDLGSMDSEGYISVRGRSREVIIRGGQNIYPPEIEQALALHPAVAAAAAIGVPDDRLGQLVAGVIVLREGYSIDGAALEAFLAEQIAYYKIPRQWRFVERMSMTASGKIRKVELGPLFDGGDE
jgi:fatty-acyl-CoA synthase